MQATVRPSRPEFKRMSDFPQSERRRATKVAIVAPTKRRSYLRLGAACAVLSAAIAVGLVLAFASGTSEAAPTKSQYFARVAAICRIYGPKLDKIPPPI